MLTEAEVADYENARENHLGFCPKCEQWTRDGTKPDADGYHECPQCGGHQVIGADDYLRYTGTLAGWLARKVEGGRGKDVRKCSRCGFLRLGFSRCGRCLGRPDEGEMVMSNVLVTYEMIRGCYLSTSHTFLLRDVDNSNLALLQRAHGVYVNTSHERDKDALEVYELLFHDGEAVHSEFEDTSIPDDVRYFIKTGWSH